MSLNNQEKNRKRGRPGRLSRNLIFESVLELLKTTDPRNLTLTAVAKNLNTAPVSLYTHVEDLDDILEGTAELVLSRLPPLERGEDSWEQQLLNWMDAVFTHLEQYPQVAKILGRNNQVAGAWMKAVCPVIELLRKNGLDGKELVMATSWIAQACVSIAIIQADLSVEQQEVNYNQLHSLTEQERQQVFHYMSQVGGLQPDEYYVFVQRRVIDSVQSLFNT